MVRFAINWGDLLYILQKPAYIDPLNLLCFFVHVNKDVMTRRWCAFVESDISEKLDSRVKVVYELKKLVNYFRVVFYLGWLCQKKLKPIPIVRFRVY